MNRNSQPPDRTSWPPERASLPPGASLPEEEMPFQIGDEIDGYRMTAILGSGSMGVVYHAKNIAEQDFAIKCVRAQESLSDEDLAIEARILARLEDDHIVRIFTARRLPKGFFMIVMELLVGETLRERMARGRLSPLEAACIGVGVARGLAYGHRISITHRDIKPENVFLTADGKVKIVDYGFAKYRKAGRASTIGKRYGTPKYAAPEQFSGMFPMGPWSDLYSLNVALYEGLTRRHPLAKGPGHEGLPGSDGMGAAHALWVPPRMETILPELSAYRDLQEVILRGLSKHPEERWWGKRRGLDLPEDRQDLVTWDYVAALEAIVPRLDAEEQRRTSPGVLDTEPMTQPPKGAARAVPAAAAVAAAPKVAPNERAAPGGAGRRSGPSGTEMLIRAPAAGGAAGGGSPGAWRGESESGQRPGRAALRTAPFLPAGATEPLAEPPSPQKVMPFVRPMPYADELRTGDVEDDDAAAGWVRVTRAMSREGHAVEKDGLIASLCLHPHPAVRAVCAEQLGRLGDARCVPELVAQLAKEKHPVVVRTIQETIAAIEVRTGSAEVSAGERGPGSMRPPAGGEQERERERERKSLAPERGRGSLAPDGPGKGGARETKTASTDVTAEVNPPGGSGEVPAVRAGVRAASLRSLVAGAIVGLVSASVVVVVVVRWPAPASGGGSGAAVPAVSGEASGSAVVPVGVASGVPSATAVSSAVPGSTVVPVPSVVPGSGPTVVPKAAAVPGPSGALKPAAVSPGAKGSKWPAPRPAAKPSAAPTATPGSLANPKNVPFGVQE